MTDDELAETAMHIADRASIGLIESEGMGSSPWTFIFDSDTWHQDEVIREAVEYLQARGLALVFVEDAEVTVIFKDCP